jgi:hypothetical protein
MKFDEKEILSFAKKVQKFVNLYGSEPDQKLCPMPYLKWQTKVGTNYKNLLTGKKYNILEHRERLNYQKDNTYWYRPNSGVLVPYVKLDKRLGVAEISMITIDTHIRGDARKFEFCGARHFMSINNPKLWAETYFSQIEVLTDQYLNNCPYSYYKGVWYTTRLKMVTYLSRLTDKSKNTIAVSKLKEILKINNVKTIEYWGKQHDINDVVAGWQFATWVEKFGKKPQKRSEQMQNTIDIIEKAGLQDIEINSKNLKKTDVPVMIYCDNIEDIAVFRIFRPVYQYTSPYTGRQCITYYEGANDSYLKMEEVYRIFLNQKNTLVYRQSISTAKWNIEKCVNPLNSVIKDISQIQYHYTFKDIEKIINMPQFKYLKNILKNQEVNLITLLNARRNKSIEQLLKIGCVNIANALAEYNTTEATMKGCFGEINAKKARSKDITKIMGMSINQIKKYENVIASVIENKLQTNLASTNWTLLSAKRNAYQKGETLLYAAKYLYIMYNKFASPDKENNISSIDILTFERMLDVLRELIDENIIRIYRNDWCYSYTYAMNRLILTDKNGIDRVKDLIKMSNMCKEVNLTLRAIIDIKNIYNGLLPEYKPENLDLQPKCASDIIRIHDTLIELQRISDQEKRRRYQLQEEEKNRLLEKQMEKFQEKRRENLYEDDEYMITIPEKLSELSEEGVTQRICIGSYINSYAEGRGNIYFLRKKEAPKTPFFAIEEKNGNIVQIHGYCNKWLGADDESFAAVPFVMRWLKKCGFTCKKEILTCRSIGYHQTNSYRELPTI